MKKYLIILMCLFMFVGLSHAQNRGVMTNTFASWYNVTTETTITLPFPSRDIYVRNGSSNSICLDLFGGTHWDASRIIGEQHCTSNSIYNPSIIQVDGDSSFIIQDFRTEALSLSPASASASPVTVIITY